MVPLGLTMVLLLLLVPLETTALVPYSRACLDSPLTILPDPTNCHLFHHCDLLQATQSCGNMMFNPVKQVKAGD